MVICNSCIISIVQIIDTHFTATIVCPAIDRNGYLRRTHVCIVYHTHQAMIEWMIDF